MSEHTPEPQESSLSENKILAWYDEDCAPGMEAWAIEWHRKRRESLREVVRAAMAELVAEREDFERQATNVIAELQGEVVAKDKRIADLEAELATPVLVATNRLADSLADARAGLAALREENARLRNWAYEAKQRLETMRHFAKLGEGLSLRRVASSLSTLLDMAPSQYDDALAAQAPEAKGETGEGG